MDQDLNWPGAQEIVELLLTIDDEIIPYIKQVLKSGDGIWIGWTLFEVVNNWSIDLKNEIKEKLLELSNTIDTSLTIEGIDICSMKFLYEYGMIDKISSLSIIDKKKVLYQEYLGGLQDFSEWINIKED